MTPHQEQAPEPAPLDGASARPRYDFRRDYQVSSDRLRPLEILYDQFAHNLGVSLSVYLRAATEVELTSVTLMPYAEFLPTLSGQTVYYAVGVDPVQGVAGLEVDPMAALAMIDRMLGGRGSAAPVYRPLTAIEQRVVDNVVRLILDHMTEEWKRVGQIEFRIQRQDARPQMLQIAAASEIVIALRLAVRLGDSRGDVKLCLPAVLLDHVAPGCVDRSVETERHTLHRNLARVPLRAEALLETPLLAADLLQLAVGDVVSLGTSVQSPVELRICGTQKFTGMLTRTDRETGLTVRSVVGDGLTLPSEPTDSARQPPRSASAIEERGGE